MIAVVFESFVRAGSQRHLLEILKGIRLYKPEVKCCLFLMTSADQNWGSFLPEIRHAGIPVICLPYVFDRDETQGIRARLRNWWSRNYRERSLNEEFYSHLKGFQSVVCAQPFVADLLLPNLKANQRLCFHFSEHPAQRSDMSHYRILKQKRLKIIYQHQSQIILLPSVYRKSNSLTWPLRLCPDHFQISPTILPNPYGVLRIAHYSRISPMRIIHKVIDAFSLLCKQTPARLRIAGFIEDPQYHQALLAQIDSLGLTNAVQFVDPVQSPAEDPARTEVDLVWMISLSGHVGYAGIEAMAAGLPTLLLEVDPEAKKCPLDPVLKVFVCASPKQLVERSLALQVDPSAFREQQAQLVVDRFITTKEAIDELTAFYLGSP